ncbi:DUF1345 domain-containing protein [Kribbella sp. NBC_01245]|uniref:DUF1345 domain-containing protein n=1 Tax=Kribbella sp. NBC_01245 TaxID=2903578 RepID=UPI002E2CEC2A|nr:DUF1345 domain-containing protein [Kribbella sp. NBC_01245]
MPKVLSGLSTVIDAGLLALGLYILFWVPQPSMNTALLGWNLLALLYLVVRVSRAFRLRPITETAWLVGPLAWRRARFVFTLLTSLIGIGCGLDIVATSNSDEIDVARLFGAAAVVVLAWFILHFGYAERYAQVYRRLVPDRSLVFPGTEAPAYLDFVYFSFTTGCSFAASDVEVRNRPTRILVLTHSVLSFFYNTAILGIAVGVISGR